MTEPMEETRLRPGFRSVGGWLLVGLLVLGAYSFTHRVGGAPPGWGSDLAAAQERASLEGRCLLIEFWLPGCTYCRIMESDVLPDDQVRQALADWIPIRLDMTQERELANRYRVTGAPTFVALGPQGREIDRITGYQPAEKFAGFLDRARKAVLTSASTSKATPEPR